MPLSPSHRVFLVTVPVSCAGATDAAHDHHAAAAAAWELRAKTAHAIAVAVQSEGPSEAL